MQTTKSAGFTIVELLIVIVVIATLASISLIAYNGITARAEDSTIATKVQAVAKMFEAYGAANSGYVPQADWACVGEVDDFPAGNGYTAGWCFQPYAAPPIPTGNDHPVNPALNTALETIVNRMPNSTLPEVDQGGGVKYKGILFDSSSNTNGGKPVLQYHVKGVRTSCPNDVVAWTGSNYTVCEYRFTDLKSITGN